MFQKDVDTNDSIFFVGKSLFCKLYLIKKLLLYKNVDKFLLTKRQTKTHSCLFIQVIFNGSVVYVWVCTWVCVCVHMYRRMHLCVCKRVLMGQCVYVCAYGMLARLGMSVCVFVCLCAYSYFCMYTWVYFYTCTCVRACPSLYTLVCMRLYMQTCVLVCIYTCMCVCVRTYACLCIWMHAYVCIYKCGRNS